MAVIRWLWRWVAVPLGLVASLLWLLISFRVLALPFVTAMIVLMVAFLLKGGRPWWLLGWLLAVVLCSVPIDVSFSNFPGPPRFVPLVMGLPTAKASQEAEEGKVMLGGCIVSGHEPRWVWVW